MIPSPEERAARKAAAKIGAQRLLASPEGEKLIAYLEYLWVKGGQPTSPVDAGWRCAMHQAIEDLEKLREEGS